MKNRAPALCVVLAAIAPLFAQVAPAPAPTAAQLAKYDLNRNGRLDPSELAALQADEARAANAAQPAAAGSAASEVVQLSPFEVNAAEDKGYAAFSTLAGTRLNSKLEDLAGSISVVTKQQLVDTAAVDLNDIFLYEVGTEGIGQFTDPTNDGRGDYDNVAGNPTGANRMRGLSQANIMIGGFAASTSIPVDSYNLDAVEIARGPNSTLAGLSDAGGSVNLITSRANTTRAFSSATARIDSYGGWRTSLDVNRPLLDRKLGVRISAVYDEKGYVRKPSVDRTNRQQIAVTYQPFRSTKLTGSFERFNEFARRANAITPRDTISTWRARGSPYYDNQTRTFYVNGQPTATNIATITTGAGGNLPAGLTLLGSSNARILQWIDDGEIKYMMRGGQPSNTATAALQFTESSSENLAGPLYKLPGTTDKSIYDWTEYNIAASNYEIQHAKVFNVNLEQGLINTQRHRLDLNLAWRREDQNDYRRMFIAQQDGVPAVLEIDTNKYLIDGRPNPLFLHPFIGGVNPQVNKRPVFNDNYRAQLAYQLDLTRENNWMKWLGLHRAIGYGEFRENIASPSSLRYHDTVVDNADFLGAGVLNPTPTTNLTNSNGALFFPMYYFGKTPGGGVEYANAGPVNPSGKYVASFFNATTNTWNTADPVTIQEVYFALGQQKKKVRTEGGSVQSYLWNNRLVTTFGLRKDRVYTIDNFGPTLANGFFDETNLRNFGVNKKWREGTTKNKGAVLKPFRGWDGIDRAANDSSLPGYFAEAVRGLSFHFNRSDTFLPADTAYNLFLQELPNPTSRGEEYGVTLSMFNKFSLRLTHQDTKQVRTRAGTGTIATRVLGLDFHPGGQNLTFNLFDAATNWQQQAHPEFTLEQAQAAAARQIGYSIDFINSANGKAIADASDAESKGWELELQFNPNRYWTVRATGNQQEAIDSNISLFIQQFIAQRMPFWTTVRGPDGSLWWETRNGSNGIPRDYFITNVQTPLNLAITTQGKKKPQTREYTFNFLTSYQLAGLSGFADTHAWLKNTSVGGSWRWASKGAIGYLAGPPDSDGVVRSLDATKPVYDKARGNVDLFATYRTRLFRNRVGTRFQLNVRNVTESGRLQPIAVNPDGRPWNYRIIDPRQFIFTVTFDL